MHQPYNQEPGGDMMIAEATAAPVAYAQVVNFSGPSAPMQPVNVVPSGHDETIHEGGAREYLSRSKWPPGLQDCFVKNAYKFAYRVFICDDSGSMDANDGSRLIDVNSDSYGHRK